MQSFILYLIVASVFAQPNPDTLLVQAHVKSSAPQTFREPSGALQFPYLVPAGPYEECWDWVRFDANHTCAPCNHAPQKNKP
jgi:hypothetical protein